MIRTTSCKPSNRLLLNCSAYSFSFYALLSYSFTLDISPSFSLRISLVLATDATAFSSFSSVSLIFSCYEAWFKVSYSWLSRVILMSSFFFTRAYYRFLTSLLSKDLSFLWSKSNFSLSSLALAHSISYCTDYKFSFLPSSTLPSLSKD